MIKAKRIFTRHPYALLLLAAALAAGVYSARSALFRDPSARSFAITETVRLRVPPGRRALQLWIPRLPSDAFQTAELVDVEAPWTHTIASDPDFGNPLLYLEAKAPEPGPVEIRLRYRVTRREQARPERDTKPVSELFTKPRGLIVIDEEVRRRAREATQDLNAPFAKAKAMYYHVLGRVDYDTTGEGWGRGDVVYACQVGKGNCTDFHSLFIAMALAEGIPARFKIGYPPIPKQPEGKLIKPYHCWAEFHIAGKGWIPVDISEAWKRPSKADYYFGRLDPDRIWVSTGREIRLPGQRGPALNYMIRPYAEIDGKPYNQIEFERRYKDIKGERT